MIVIDNFLDEDQFNLLYSLIDPFSDGDKFYFLPYAKVRSDGNKPGNFQFVHNLMTQGSLSILSQVGIEERLQPLAFVKAKINFALQSRIRSSAGWHTDIPSPDDVKARTGILYLNDNNGFTEFDTGKQVTSVANRYVEFDSNQMHRGVDCSDAPWRAVLNINYIPSTNSPIYMEEHL